MCLSLTRHPRYLRAWKRLKEKRFLKINFALIMVRLTSSYNDRLIFQSMGYAPYLRSVGQIDHTLTGSKVDGFVISRTEAFEQHVITPFSRSGGQVTASSRYKYVIVVP